MAKEDPHRSGRWFPQAALTEVKTHAQEHNEAKPGIEEHAEVDDANNNVSQGGDDVEHQVARRGSQSGERKVGRFRPSNLTSTSVLL